MVTTPLPNNLTGSTPSNSPSHATAHNTLAEYIAGLPLLNAKGAGCEGDGVTDDSVAILAAIASFGADGGTLFFPPGIYAIGQQIVVPSRVAIKGSGRGTSFRATAGFTGTMFTVSHPSAAYDNIFGQGFNQAFIDFEIADRNSADTYLTPTGRTENHSGIELFECDQVLIQSVFIRDLKGFGVKLNGVVRECTFRELYIHNCGDSANTIAALELTQTTGEGDDVNINLFYDCRIIYPEYYGLRVWGSLNNGVRQTVFIGGQMEGGGAGSGGTLGTPRAYDVVHLERCNDIFFYGVTFSNPGSTKFLVNCAGEDAGDPVLGAYFSNCHFEGASLGGGIKATYVTNISVEGCNFVTSHATYGDINIDASAGTVWLGLGNQYSANPFVGTAGHRRGKTDNAEIKYENMALQAGGFQILDNRAGYGMRGDSDGSRWYLWGAYTTLTGIDHFILMPAIYGGGAPTDPFVVRWAGKGDYNSTKAVLWPDGVVNSVYAGTPTDALLGLTDAARDGMWALDTTNWIWYSRKNGVWTPQQQMIAELHTPVDLASSVTETSMWSFSIPAGLLSSTRKIHVRAVFRVLNDSGGADTLTFLVKLGTTTLFKDSFASMATTAVADYMVVDFVLANQNAANDQKLIGSVLRTPATIAPTTGFGSLATAGAAFVIAGDAAEDTTSAKTLDLRAQHSRNNAGTKLTIEAAYAEIIAG